MATKEETFDEWLLTQHGEQSNDYSTLTGQYFLTNRLWWAYQAGYTSKLSK